MRSEWHLFLKKQKRTGYKINGIRRRHWRQAKGALFDNYIARQFVAETDRDFTLFDHW